MNWHPAIGVKQFLHRQQNGDFSILADSRTSTANYLENCPAKPSNRQINGAINSGLNHLIRFAKYTFQNIHARGNGRAYPHRKQNCSKADGAAQ